MAYTDSTSDSQSSDSATTNGVTTTTTTDKRTSTRTHVNYLPPQALTVSATNARYLIKADGTPLYLVGFHTWYNIQDNQVATFDWDAYLTALVSYGCNFTKLWANESGRGWAGYPNEVMTPTRYTRTGPGNDADGKLKFDLTQINPDYLDRLYDRVGRCDNAGIYVCVQLFQGWQIESKGMGASPFTYHPYRAENNINSVDGDDDNDGEGTETHWPAAQGNNVLAYQEAMVEAILDKLNNYDNVIYEISNEDTDDASGYNTDWQEYMIGYIRTYEAGLPKQHLVGMTKQFPNGEDATLDASGADWVSYSDGKGLAVHAATDPVSMSDTDHLYGITTEYSWLWEAFCNGHGGSWFMDKWYPNMYAEDTRETAADVLIRQNLGYLLDIVDLLDDLLGMTPQAALCSTSYCLARDHATAAEYVCYQSNTGNFTLDLSTATGTLNIRWLRCATGATDTGTVAGGDVRTLTPPWAGVVVAYVYH